MLMLLCDCMRFVHVLGALFVTGTVSLVLGQTGLSWSNQELMIMRKLWIQSLGQEPLDLSNAVADDPRAMALGHKLFFDPGLSEDGSVACATCHNPETAFADNNELAEGRGTAPRNTPTIIGSAFNRFQFWDGRSDSLWSQALGPLESAVEHGTNRIFVARQVFKAYRAEYETIFGPMTDFSDETRFPTQSQSLENIDVRIAWDVMRLADQQAVLKVFTNVGKSMAAYERLLRPGAAPFDQFAESVLETNDADGFNAISADAQAGLKLFIGKAKCVDCHSSALFNDTNFYNTGLIANKSMEKADAGRSRGLLQLEQSGFSCFSLFSDAKDQCVTTRNALGLSATETPLANSFENTATLTPRTISSSNSPDDVVEIAGSAARFTEWLGAFKTPTLRNVVQTAPYMHAGQIKSLKLAVEHYNLAPKAVVGETKLKPLALSPKEVNQVVEFLETLNSPVDAPSRWLEAPR